MASLTEHIAPLTDWLPSLAVVLAVNLVIAALNRPLGHLRWLFAVILAAAPGIVPPTADRGFPWGAAATIVTTLAIGAAARLPDLDHTLRSGARPRLQLFLWITLPVIRFTRPGEEPPRRKERARRFLLMGALKLLAWEPFRFTQGLLDGAEVHWLFKSAVLMLYFVLTLTAFVDLVSALCLALKFDVDELFDAPLRSVSPRDFWSSRWNKFINRFALKHVALPLRKTRSPLLLMLAVFFTSGLFHEYFAWGVAGSEAALGWMSAFFIIQGIIVWLGDTLRPPKLPPPIGTALTFFWMMCTAPMFFKAVSPAVLAFGYPVGWLPLDAPFFSFSF